MIQPRYIALGLLGLDVGSTVLVFNLMNQIRGVPVAHQLLLLPLAAPVVALVATVYLIQGYRPQTDLLSADYASQHTIAMVGATMATLLLTYAFLPPGYELAPQSSRIVIGLSFLTLAPLTLA